MSVSPNLEDYADLFESEPVAVSDAGWHYGAEFLVKQGHDELRVLIAPDEAQLDLVWTQQGRRRMALSLRMVVNWLIEKRGASTHLIVRVNTGPQALCHFDYCLLRIKPEIEVDCQMSWGPGWDTASNPAFQRTASPPLN